MRENKSTWEIPPKIGWYGNKDNQARSFVETASVHSRGWEHNVLLSINIETWAHQKLPGTQAGFIYQQVDDQAQNILVILFLFKHFLFNIDALSICCFCKCKT